MTPGDRVFAEAVDWHIQYHDEVVSTNDLAWEAFEQGAPGKTVIVACSQTRGRGRRGRSWVSQPDAGLWFSILLKPRLHPAQTAWITARMAVAVTDVLRRQYALEARVKWPNDVVVSNRKIGGILTETRIAGDRLHAVVAGIGINTNIEIVNFGGDFDVAPTSLLAETTQTVDHRHLLEREILPAFERSVAMPEDDLQALWASRSSLLGRKIRVQVDNAWVEGRCVNLEIGKGLTVLTNDGRRCRFHGDGATVRPL